MPQQIIPTEPPNYVITCGDEGVQINYGQRFSFVGSGYKLEGFSEAVKILKKLLNKDREITISSNQENDWFKKQLGLTDWNEINAAAKKEIKALAEQVDLKFTGDLPFSDPRKLKYDIKGHMVRPKGMHVANKLCFTLGGGEQIYSLACYQISADWVHKAKKKLVETVILPQIKFYKKVAGIKLEYVFDETGEFGEKIAAKNRKVLEKLGIKAAKKPEEK